MCQNGALIEALASITDDDLVLFSFLFLRESLITDTTPRFPSQKRQKVIRSPTACFCYYSSKPIVFSCRDMWYNNSIKGTKVSKVITITLKNSKLSEFHFCVIARVNTEVYWIFVQMVTINTQRSVVESIYRDSSIDRNMIFSTLLLLCQGNYWCT